MLGHVRVLALVLLALARPPARRRSKAAKGSRCRTRSWNCGAQVQMLRDSRRGAAAPTYLGGGSYPPPSAAAAAIWSLSCCTRVDALEEQVRQLRGRVDETQNQVQRQGAETRQADRGHGVPGAEPAGGAPGRRRRRLRIAPPESGADAAADLARGPRRRVRRRAPVRRTPELAMQEGNAALARRDYPAAEAAAREVLPAAAPRRAPMTRSSCWPRR